MDMHELIYGTKKKTVFFIGKCEKVVHIHVESYPEHKKWHWFRKMSEVTAVRWFPIKKCRVFQRNRENCFRCSRWTVFENEDRTILNIIRYELKKFHIVVCITSVRNSSFFVFFYLKFHHFAPIKCHFQF